MRVFGGTPYALWPYGLWSHEAFEKCAEMGAGPQRLRPSVGGGAPYGLWPMAYGLWGHKRVRDE
eukprot:1709356-Pyramimonas_sp.AAC.1